MDEKKQIQSINNGIIIAIIVGIVLILGIVIISDIGTISTDITPTPSSSNFLPTSTSNTLTPIGEGISSATIKTPNQTWLEFDGVNDYVNGSLIGLNGENISIIQGFKWLGNSTTTGRILQMCGRDLGLYKQNNVDYMKITYSNATKTVDSSTYNGNITDGLWKQAVVVYNGTVNVWQNTNFLQTRNDITGDLNSTSNCYVGSLTNTFGNSNISIDNYRIFNKSITQGTINYFFNSSIQGNNLGNGIPVYMLHVIDSTPTFTENWNSTTFNNTIDYLYSEGYESITYKDYINWTKNLKSINRKSFIFSFDDGANSVYVNAYPKMKEKGFVGSVSIITELVGEATYMTWANINDLKNNGWEIVSHSINTSNYLTTLDYNSRQYAFNKSRYDILANTSFFPTIFVFPQGGTNSTIDEECLNYYESCISDSSTIGLPSYNYKINNYSLDIVRITVINETTLQEIKDSNVYDKLLKEYLLNENSGTIAYDSSGNNNHGTISGATWKTDGVLNTLTEGVDYTLNKATGVLVLSADYVYNWIEGSWVYSYRTLTSTSIASENMVGALSSGTIWISIFIVTLFAIVILRQIIENFEKSVSNQESYY
jgi:peptidoglycan/xylan/chitin deacetylase (PgdA/CDA1 family)